ncbi:hypothetical protein BX666DRAFT_2118500 [Dichotomocladium elegans]|nr:hypothetical protein BX666DRAFT_2118500 [Dichotomocladium elegans]
MLPPPPAFDPKSSSCPSLTRPNTIHGSQKTYDIFPPDAPPEYYYYAYSTTDSATTNASTVVASDSVQSVSIGSGSKSTAVTSTDGGSEQSEWLQKCRQYNSRSRIIFGVFGMLFFLLIITSTIVWISNVVILPQVHYSTEYSQNTNHMQHKSTSTAPSGDFSSSKIMNSTPSSLSHHN